MLRSEVAKRLMVFSDVPVDLPASGRRQIGRLPRDKAEAKVQQAMTGK